ncbi:uncharacterized protein LOC6735022 [Drosophila simulans]|uniref:GD25431 n=1 Tax=Drosophila simulans TaxID=7240 RepID=B4QBS8_DROSI|nr:uncharacterized protein LOC6735022 [Drosophila simulans]EDX07588.1 GD25431 [Drosophila simulans]KMY94714.1 uncharacterized protein Dsimw501_GD25431 [Drosophila simulans]
MWSVRRGIASATAEGLRKFSPNLGEYSNQLQSWYPPVSHSTNFVKNLEATSKCRNYLRITDEPELPNLANISEQVSRGSHTIPVGSTKLRRSVLDDPPKKFWQKNDSEKYHRTLMDLKTNNSASKSNSTINGSYKPEGHLLSLTEPNSHKSSNTPKNSTKNIFRKIVVPNILKFNNPILKMPATRSVHSNSINMINTPKFLTNNIFQNSSYESTKQIGHEINIPPHSLTGHSKSHINSRQSQKRRNFQKNSKYFRKFAGIKKFKNKNDLQKTTSYGSSTELKTETKNYSERFHPQKQSRKKFRKSTDEKLKTRTLKIRKSAKTNIKNRKSSSRFSMDSQDVSNTKARGQVYTVPKPKDANASQLPDQSKNEISLEHSNITQFDRESSTTWVSKLDKSFVSSGPTDLYDFRPLDIHSYLKFFESSHSIPPYTKVPWPTPVKPVKRSARSKEKKVVLHLAPRKPIKKKYCTTGLCKRPSCFARPYKYHLFRFEICRRKRKAPVKAVSCQTEVNRNRCELCEFSRPKSDPDEPFMIEMKKRQNREQLKQYYLKMAAREKISRTETLFDKEPDLKPTEPTSKSFSKSRTTCNNVGKMRHELKQCLVTLNLCGRLVEDWLQLSRCKRRN